MNKLTTLKTSFILAAMLALPMAQAAGLSKDEYKAGKDRISADHKADKAACDGLKDNAKDVCIEEAKGKEKVARAELEYNYTGKASDQNKLWVAKAKAAYEVAKEKCDDQSGNAKDVCVKQAKATEESVLADAKLSKQVHKAENKAADTKTDADYKLAKEKCDALSGDAKDSCVATAKAKFGKN